MKFTFAEFGAKISVLPKYMAIKCIHFAVWRKGLNPYLCTLKIIPFDVRNKDEDFL